MNGLLGSELEFETALRNTAPTRPQTPEEWRKQSADFAQFIDDGVKAREKAARDSDEAEIDALVRESLERKYGDIILARQTKTLSERTRVQYIAAYARFKNFCKDGGVGYLPAASGSVASFLNCELETGVSASRVRLLSAAISHGHKISGHADPCGDPLVEAVVYAATLKQKAKKGAQNGKAHH